MKPATKSMLKRLAKSLISAVVTGYAIAILVVFVSSFLGGPFTIIHTDWIALTLALFAFAAWYSHYIHLDRKRSSSDG